MRVLVTGGGSMLMAGVARALHERGDDVRCLQRRPVELPDAITQCLGDIRDDHALDAALANCDAVLHGAARVGVVGSQHDFTSVNLDGTRQVIAAAKRAGVRNMVYVSTPSVAHIGRSLVGEHAGPALTGRRDRAHYAETKAQAELLALNAADSGFGVVAIRPHLVWGPGDQQLVGRIVERARSGRLAVIDGGRALVDTTYVDNAVDALVAALDAVEPDSVVSGRAYLVANGEPRPIRELLLGICRAAGIDPALRSVPAGVARAAGSVLERLWPLLRDDEPPLTRFIADQLATAHWFNLSATFTDLGWRPRVTLDDGLAALARWFAASSVTDGGSHGVPTLPAAAG